MNLLVLRNPTPAEPVVLIPGFMADARSFMPQLARLGADRPIVLLTPGLGDSVEKIAADIAPHLPPQFALVAHGLGGNIAIEILRKRPEAVTRVALISTDPLPIRHKWRPKGKRCLLPPRPATCTPAWRRCCRQTPCTTRLGGMK